MVLIKMNGTPMHLKSHPAGKQAWLWCIVSSHGTSFRSLDLELHYLGHEYGSFRMVTVACERILVTSTLLIEVVDHMH